MNSEHAKGAARSFIPETIRAGVRDFRESFHRLFSSTYYHNSVDSSARIDKAILGGQVFIGYKSVISGDVRIGKYSFLNSRCLLLGGKITIGNYCQFGPQVAIYTVNHSTRHLTTHNSDALFGGALKQLSARAEVEIGHDVWLGHGALIMPGVTLGTGCVVGAGAVVTKAVPPYAIVGGCPARLIKYRLPEPFSTMALNSHWWCLDPEELAHFQDVFTELPDKIKKSRLEELSRLGTERARSIATEKSL